MRSCAPRRRRCSAAPRCSPPAATRRSRRPTGSGRAPGRSSPRWNTRPACAPTASASPTALLFETALDRLGPGRSLMVGDRLDADLAGAARGRDRLRDRVDRRQHPRRSAARLGAGAGCDRRRPPGARARMRLSVIVNPVAGGGRAGRALPAVRAELHRLGLEHHVQATLSLEHARALARDAIKAGEIAVAFGGDGLIGAVAGALRHSDGVLGVLPGGRGNDFARSLSIPVDPVSACAVLTTGSTKRLDLGCVGGRTFIGIASCGFDSVANRIANETKLVRGNLVYAYGAMRALAGWRRRLVHGHRRRRRAALAGRLHGRGRQLRPLRRRHAARARRPARRRAAGARDHLRRAAPAVPADAADGVQGRARPSARVRDACARAGCGSPPRGRSRCTPTATRSPSCRPRSRCCRRPCRRSSRRSAPAPAPPDRRPRHRHERARREGRRGADGRAAGATRRAGRRHQPAGQGAHAAGAGRDRAAGRPPARRLAR